MRCNVAYDPHLGLYEVIACSSGVRPRLLILDQFEFDLLCAFARTTHWMPFPDGDEAVWVALCDMLNRDPEPP